MADLFPTPRDAQLPDAAIFARVCDGETELFEILLRRHNQMVYRSVRSILRNEAEVEDAMQQAYLSAFACRAQFAGGSRFSTWLVRIAINKALVMRRGGALRVVSPEPVEAEEANIPPDTRENPEDRAASRELGVWLSRAIDALPELYRTTVMLRDVEGMSTHEVADALQVSEEVVKTRLHRARAAIRERASEDLDAGAGQVFGFHATRCDRVVAAVMAQLRR